ncbi:MAG: selenide, water dikinase SelD [Granulosicoccus sp.]
MNNPSIVRDICLLGGGHSHVLLIRQWAMNPLPGVRLSLVSSANQTPYSGMLPGLIAGHYSVDEIHVDLLNLCTWAGVRFIEDTVVGLDLESKQLRFTQRPVLEFDVLSLDTGSTPDLSVPGSKEFVTPVKPVHNFFKRWQALLERVEEPGSDNLAIGVVGSGAGGFELVTAMRYALRDTNANCLWFLRGEKPIRGRPEKVGELALKAATRLGINVVSNFDVARVKSGCLEAVDGRVVELDEILWCTAAMGPTWPADAGLSTDKRGFVATRATLQSESHDFVFATGDIGTQTLTPSAKAGVFAVRQAPYLFKNLRAYVLGEKLVSYEPQKDFLSLMATGEKSAIASRGAFALEANWIWRWKDSIDQKFMRKFTELPAMKRNPAVAVLPNALRELDNIHASNIMPCRGCGAKVGADTLESVIEFLNPIERDDVVTELSDAGDAAVLQLGAMNLVQSVDQINAIVDDQYLLGRMAALHALSDVVTLDATPQSAQVVVTVAEASPTIVERDLRLLMSGIVDALNQEGCALVGGHTTQGKELSVALVVNAVMQSDSSASTTDSEEKLRSSVALSKIKVGDVLVLTQPLGIGTLFAGLMQQKANGNDVSNAIRVMLQSNSVAATTLRQHGASVMTDVTGFGLLGHLERLFRGSALGANIAASRVPVLSGAFLLSENMVHSSLWQQNKRVLPRFLVDAEVPLSTQMLLCDPQTGGGLLAVIPAHNKTSCLEKLALAGYGEASVIGTVHKEPHLRLG